MSNTNTTYKHLLAKGHIDAWHNIWRDNLQVQDKCNTTYVGTLSAVKGI